MVGLHLSTQREGSSDITTAVKQQRLEGTAEFSRETLLTERKKPAEIYAKREKQTDKDNSGHTARVLKI